VAALTEFEKWTKLREALRRRLSQAQHKEATFKDPNSILTIQYAQLVLKDVIRIMDLLEEQ
jgi:hypothetical protein